MQKKSFLTVLFTFLLIVSLSLGNVSIALADDAAPGEMPDAVSTEEPVDSPVIEAPASESTPESVMEESVPGPEAVTSSDEATESTTDEGLLTQLPPNTEVVVLDEDGDTVPLVTQEALDVILDTDPMWCPVGTLPGGLNCTINFLTINDLLTDMRNNTANYNTNGVIYFTANAGAPLTLTPSKLGAGPTGDYNTLKNLSLILQGGWNGQNGTDADFTGQTSFGSNPVIIGASDNPWVGGITLRNFLFSGVTGDNAIAIYTTTGAITLDNVDVVQQAGTYYTANLDSVSGNITVENGSSFDGNNTGTRQSQGFRAETGGSITITGSSGTPITFSESRGTSSSNYNGATLSAPTVTLNYVTANNNDLNGILITNANVVTLNNVLANANGTDDAALPDSQDVGSGVLVNGTGSTLVNLIGGTFTNNERYGVEVTNGSINIISSPTCSGNDLGCLIDSNPPTLNLPGNITMEAPSAAGAVVAYSATATDNLDGNLAIICSHASGTMFPIGTTTVDCSATDSHHLVASGSFTVTVQDTTAPTIAPHAGISAKTRLYFGKLILYESPATTDLVDGTGVATCTPASGTVFKRGSTVVTCTATDSHGNSATPVTFVVSVRYIEETTSNQSSQGDYVIPVTAGELIDLDCSTAVSAFGILVNFHNLCDYQAIITSVDSNTLPGQLDGGMSLANGVNITLLLNGEVVAELPAGSGVDVRFPISEGPDALTALLWDAASGDWMNASQTSIDTDNAFYRVMTTEYAGTIVIASK